MSRPLKIPRETALNAAMFVFWSKGYGDTSIDDLQKAMGLQRGSFYLHFKDKRTLFIEVLDQYKINVVEKRRALIRAQQSPKAGIKLYFKILLVHLIEKKENNGCLNTNTATELGYIDAEISEKLGQSMIGWKDFWAEILTNAKIKKEINSDLDINSTAQMLVALTQGLNVIARVNPDPRFLKGVVKSGLAVLN